MLHPDFFQDSTLLSLTPIHRLLFAGLWGLADREGRLVDKPIDLKIKLLPADDCEVDSLLYDLASAGRIVRYEISGQRFIQVVNFNRYQKPHWKEAASKIPPLESIHEHQTQGSVGIPRGTNPTETETESVYSLQFTESKALSDSSPQLQLVSIDGRSALDPVRAKRKRLPSAQEQIAQRLERLRVERLGDGCLPDRNYRIASLNRMLKPLTEVKDDVLERAYLLYLDDLYPADLDPPYPLGLFASQWVAWVSKAVRGQVGEETDE